MCSMKSDIPKTLGVCPTSISMQNFYDNFKENELERI